MPSTRPFHRARRLSLALRVSTASALAVAPTIGFPQEFEVDEAAAERALERALVQTGSILLEPRELEIVPFFAFSRSEGETFSLATAGDDDFAVASTDNRDSEFSAGVTLRAGLPWSGQIDLTVPLGYTDSDTFSSVDGAIFEQSSESAAGFGDVSVSYSHALRGEGDGLPSLIASLSWDTDTGHEQDGVSLGSGFHEIEAALIATLAQDPLVFTGRIGYERSIEEDDVQPGDVIRVSGATFLAVNPETSLSFGFSVDHTSETEVEGSSIEGSDQIDAFLDVGVATILRRNLLLDTTLSVGLTDDAPDFSIQVSLPFRTSF